MPNRPNTRSDQVRGAATPRDDLASEDPSEVVETFHGCPPAWRLPLSR